MYSGQQGHQISYEWAEESYQANVFGKQQSRGLHHTSASRVSKQVQTQTRRGERRPFANYKYDTGWQHPPRTPSA